MDLIGKVITILPVQTGQSARGTWTKTTFVIEVPDEKYPSHAVFSTFDTKVAEYVKVGAMVDVSFDIDAREYQGKWFTDLKAWKVVPVQGQDAVTAPPVGQIPPQPVFEPQPADDDLPF